MMYRKDRLLGQNNHPIILAFMATASLAVIIIPFTGSKFRSLAAIVSFGTNVAARVRVPVVGAPPPPPIASISVCSSDNSGGTLQQGSCPPGSFDTHQNVLAPDGSGINKYVNGGVSDEHQTVFSPGKLGGNSDYLFFVATRTALNSDTGVVVLSGVPGKEPDAQSQWTMDFAKGYGSYPSASPSPSPPPPPYGQIFLSPVGRGCPNVADGMPGHQDQTFDLNYAAPGSVVVDPTNSSGSLLMIYEGTNTCFGTTGGPRSNNFYSTVGIATSLDYGHAWPTYRDNPSFAFVPLPGQNTMQGPNPGPSHPMPALGNQVYEGNDTHSTPPASYGRYAVLSPSVSLATAMATATPLQSSMGDSEMSAFIDDVNGNPAPYLYVVYDDGPGAGALADPQEGGGLTIARGRLNGGTAPLSFVKWNGQAFSSPGIGGLDSAIFPAGPFERCEANGQIRVGSSISYVEATHQYLLTFVCDSPGDPVGGQQPGAHRGGAWFYATSYDPSQPQQWSQPDPLGHPQPQEIEGSWDAFESTACGDYKGWYPTFMSLNSNSGHLSTSGYVFYLYGCQTGNTPQPPGRQYSSRAFTITTATPTPTPTPTPKTIQFNSAGFSVNEGAGDALVTVTRGGDPAAAATVDYATSDTAGANNCNVTNGAASSRCDYLTTIGTLHFAANETSKTISIPIVDDSYAEGNETFAITLSNPSGATLGSPATATVTIIDNDSANGVNPLETAGFFVRQHYIDFLNREPDTGGLNFWTNEITSCGSNQSCIDVKRVNVSAAFFISIEFQQTGYLVYRIYKSAYGDLSGAPVPVRLNEFLPDTQEIGQGVIVNQGNWQQQLENNKQAFTLEFVQRSRFTSAYATSLTPAQFVAMMFANAGVTPSSADRTTAINEFGGATTTADVAARSRALRDVAENSTLNQQEFNRAFVLMQYFGYLRRNPYDPPEPTLDYQGYNFWLNKLNSFGGNYITAEMVKAFITSSEYRQRFGP